jgi:hypothetical protein
MTLDAAGPGRKPDAGLQVTNRCCPQLPIRSRHRMPVDWECSTSADLLGLSLGTFRVGALRIIMAWHCPSLADGFHFSYLKCILVALALHVENCWVGFCFRPGRDHVPVAGRMLGMSIWSSGSWHKPVQKHQRKNFIFDVVKLGCVENHQSQ